MSAFLKDGTYHSKPDMLSDTYELRRLKLRKLVSNDPAKSTNPDWPETRFLRVLLGSPDVRHDHRACHVVVVSSDGSGRWVLHSAR